MARRRGGGGHGVHHGRHQNDVPLWQGTGVGGSTASTTATVRNDVPHASKSAAAASLQGWKLSCSGEGEDAATTVAMTAAAMPSRWRQQEQALDGALRAGRGGGNAVTTAAAMSLRRGQAVEDTTRGGGGRLEAL